MSRVDVKVVLLGKEYGGKTSLVERYLNDRFLDLPYQNTIGAAFGAKKVDVDGRKITMGIWDTAGGERYEAMSRIYYRGARGAVVCYDVTEANSFERAKFWVGELKKNEETCNIYLCGTKKDLVDDRPELRRVSYSQVIQYASNINADVFETSSKSGESVKEVFNKIAEDFAKQSENFARMHVQERIRLTPEPKRTFLCC